MERVAHVDWLLEQLERCSSGPLHVQVRSDEVGRFCDETRRRIRGFSELGWSVDVYSDRSWTHCVGLRIQWEWQR